MQPKTNGSQAHWRAECSGVVPFEFFSDSESDALETAAMFARWDRERQGAHEATNVTVTDVNAGKTYTVSTDVCKAHHVVAHIAPQPDAA